MDQALLNKNMRRYQREQGKGPIKTKELGEKGEQFDFCGRRHSLCVPYDIRIIPWPLQENQTYLLFIFIYIKTIYCIGNGTD